MSRYDIRDFVSKARDDKHSTRASTALQKLAERDPGFASLSIWINHRDSDQDIAPAWTDQKTIFYGADFEKFTLDEKIAVCAHEIWHVAFRHITRGHKLYGRIGKNFHPMLWNIAIDGIINDALSLGGYRLPGNHISLKELLKQYDGVDVDMRDAIGEWDAEKLYMHLLEKIKQQSEGDGDAEGDGQGGGGGGAGDLQDPGQDIAAKKGFNGDLDYSKVSESGEGGDSAGDQEWATRLARAQLAGNGKGALGHIIADIPVTRTPWETVLRTKVTRAVTFDPKINWSRPNRSWLGQEADARRRGAPTPIYQAGMQQRSDKPTIFVGVDVSGSVDDAMLNRFASEIVGIGQRTGAQIVVCVFDHGIHSVTTLRGADWKGEITKIEFARGGGTSFIEPIAEAVKAKASIAVILTDLYGPFPEAPRGIPVIWATLDDEKSAPKPPFGALLSLAR